jgi:hypothetical protein
LVIQGRLVSLSKPLLVLKSRRIAPADAEGDAVPTSPNAAGKRKRGAAEEATGSGSAKKPREAASATASPSATAGSAAAAASSSASAANSSSAAAAPSSCLQSVAVIRHKYVFSNRPYAICDMGDISAPTPAAKSAAAAAAKQAASLPMKASGV